ncbi:MAG: SsrA-binding protein [candidate division SR1 bacterium]|nr:MAG: SsrA-binding protein [candidate division SR1 bacterium]
MKILTKNKRAYFDYEFSKFYTAGIVLAGHEVKSVKTSNLNIADAIAHIENKALWLKNMDIPLYTKASLGVIGNYEPKQKRKLLLKKYEIGKIAGDLDKSGNVLIPLEVFLTKTGWIKIKLGIGKLKRKIEKKQLIKERDISRQMDREIRGM